MIRNIFSAKKVGLLTAAVVAIITIDMIQQDGVGTTVAENSEVKINVLETGGGAISAGCASKIIVLSKISNDRMNILDSNKCYDNVYEGTKEIYVKGDTILLPLSVSNAIRDTGFKIDRKNYFIKFR